MAQMQTERHVEFITPLGEDVLLFKRMSVSEELGRMFQLELELISRRPDINFDELLGQNVTVRIELPDRKQRYFNGFVSRFNQSDTNALEEDHTAYSATVRPWLWFLTRTADCRIFQNEKAPDIIKKIFREHGFTDFEDKLSGSYRKWEYCVQYRETDFNFISRLMEQEGFYYFFKHEENKHTLVIADDISAHSPFTDYEEIPYFPPDESLRREREHVFDWTITKEVKPGVYALNEFNFKKPKANLEVKAAVSRDHVRSDMEIFDYPGEYTEADEGETYVRTRIEELHAQYEQIRGQTNARGFCVGSLFQLADYPRSDQNREYLIVSARHEIETNDYSTSGSGGGGETYSCSFTVLESGTPFRSSRSTPKPIVQGPQTAMVVGKPGEEIWTEEYGRVKIQFHWDRYGKQDQDSSCWVRVSHPWAGKNWGSVAVPRIGQEVIVEFIEGDPDRPIITGRVYNKNSMPPYELPGSGMVSGLKSNSTPGGGGYNEMSMDDTKGKEKITIHAQKDMNTTVENNRTATIKSGNDTITVKSGTRSVTVKGDTSLTVQAGSRNVSVTGGDYKAGVSGGDFSATASKAVSLQGSSKGVTITGKGGPGVKIGGDPNFEATGKAEAKVSSPTVTISGKSTIQLNSPHIGMGNKMVVVNGTQIIIDGGTVSIGGATSVVINGGGSSVKVDGSGVSVTGSPIKLNC